jgi:hypothetical protein
MPKTDQPAERQSLSHATANALLGPLEPSPGDGSIILKKITTTSIGARPERCVTRNAPVRCFMVAGRAVAERLMPPPNGMPQGANPDAFTALIADVEGWIACTFGDEGEPDAVYRSDLLFLPYTARVAVLRRIRAHGSPLIALLFSAKPAANKRGYRWSYHNLATLEGFNPDRLTRV